jgi:hypothetical protein
MTELSRMKKFEDLRESIQNDREGDTHSEALSPFAQRLSRIDATFKSMQSQTTTSPHLSQHGKKDIRFDSTTSGSGVATFNNEYLDDFIEEVKNYNIKKGYRSHEDTDSNIFSQANKELKEVVSEPKRRPIVFASQNKLEEPNDSVELNEAELNLTNEIKQVITSDQEQIPANAGPKPFTDKVDSNGNMQSVLDETQKLRVQLDEYEKELVGVNISVNKSNRLLNFIVIAMVLVLLVMLGTAVYWVLIARGFIR